MGRLNRIPIEEVQEMRERDSPRPGQTGGLASLPAPESPLPSPAEKGGKSFLDNILDVVKSVPLSLDQLEEEEEDKPGEEKAPAESSLFGDPKFTRRYFTGQDRKLLEQFSGMAKSSLNLKESRPELRRNLLAIRAEYRADFGGEGNLSQSQSDLIDSVVWLTLIEHLVGSSSLRFGAIKLNRSTGKISLQPVLEKNLIGIVNCKRLLIKTLVEISSKSRMDKMTFRFGRGGDPFAGMSEQEIEKEEREIDLLLARKGIPQELKGRRLQSVTLERKVTEVPRRKEEEDESLD